MLVGNVLGYKSEDNIIGAESNGGLFEFTWTINNWSDQSPEYISPEFVFDGHAFVMRAIRPMYPTQCLIVKVVLQQAFPAPKTISFTITLLKLHKPENSFMKKSAKAFYKLNSYETFPLAQGKHIFDYLDQDKLTIILRHAPTGKNKIRQLNSHVGSPTPQPIQKPIGLSILESPCASYAGLRNQGATCYLNSLLQLYFHLPVFRNIVYHMPTTGAEDPETSIPINLQNLFCRMQSSSACCNTVALTRSFGWDYNEITTQQDIQEFSRLLFENLLDKVKNTWLEEQMMRLFRGKERTIIKCRNVPYESTVDSEFYDLSLQVIDCKSLHDAFVWELETDHLIGKEQYKTEDYGLQDADICYEFLKLPEILFLHLRRFQRDTTRNCNVKVNTRFEFPREIDLGEFIPADSSRSYGYDLFGVLVHSGSVVSGHYYAYLRTSPDPQWYKFDDATVTKVSETEAIENNYGSPDRSYSAYMLIYVRKDDIPFVYEPVPVPQHLLSVISNTKEISSNDYIDIKVLTEETLKKNTIGFEGRQYINFKTSKDMPAEKVYRKIADITNKSVDKIRIWRCGAFSVPHEPIMANEEKISTFMNESSSIFVQDIKEEDSIELNDELSTVFLKFYYGGNDSTIDYICSVTVRTISDCIEIVKERLDIPSNTPLLVFQETVQRTAQLISIDTELNSGTILIFQVAPDVEFRAPKITKDETKELPIVSYENENIFTVDQVLDKQLHTLNVILFEASNPKDPLFVLRFPSNLPLINVKKLIAAALHEEYDSNQDSIRLFKRDPATNGPMRHPIITRFMPSFRAMNISNGTNGYPKFYFSFHRGIPEAEMENMVHIKVSIALDGYHISNSLRILITKGSKIRDIAEKVHLDPHSIRATTVFGCKIMQKKLSLDTVFINYDHVLRFDVIPPEHKDVASQKEKIVPVLHGFLDIKNVPKFVCEPFMFKIAYTQTISDVRDQILSIANIEEKDKDFAVILIIAQDKSIQQMTESQTFDNIVGSFQLFIWEPRLDTGILKMDDSYSKIKSQEQKKEKSIKILH